jgi:hypothetical protein
VRVDAKRAALLWILGLLTLVPYGTYHLLFQAPREQYALLIVGLLFWVFGYWGLVGPLLAALKVRAVFKAIELARSKDELLKVLKSPDARDTAIDMIALDNHIPRFLAARVYALLVRRLAERSAAPVQGGG